MFPNIKPSYDLKIYWEVAGLISENRIWVCFSDGYMYTADTLEELLTVINNEWKLDQHLAQ